MSYDLIRLALQTLPPVPADPYLEAERRNPALEERGLSESQRLYAVSVQRWLMAVRWRASLRPADGTSYSTIPGEEWKRLLRPWLASLTTESPSAHGKAAGFDGWRLLCDYMHAVEQGRDPSGLGALTAAEANAIRGDAEPLSSGN